MLPKPNLLKWITLQVSEHICIFYNRDLHITCKAKTNFKHTKHFSDQLIISCITLVPVISFIM